MPCSNKLDEAALNRARALYEGTRRSLAAIGAELGVTPTTIRYHALTNGWERAALPPGLARAVPTAAARRAAVTTGAAADPAEARRKAMIARLHRAFERQVSEWERRLAEAGAAIEEKDARTLGMLARTLEKLIDLERGRSDGEADDAADPDRLREQLAHRLRRWAEGGRD